MVSASSAFAGASFANAFNEELLPFFFFKEEEEDDEDDEDDEEEDVCDGLLFSFFATTRSKSFVGASFAVDFATTQL